MWRLIVWQELTDNSELLADCFYDWEAFFSSPKIETARSSIVSVNIYQTEWYHNIKYSNIFSHHSQKLKFNFDMILPILYHWKKEQVRYTFMAKVWTRYTMDMVQEVPYISKFGFYFSIRSIS